MRLITRELTKAIAVSVVNVRLIERSCLRQWKQRPVIRLTWLPNVSCWSMVTPRQVTVQRRSTADPFATRTDASILARHSLNVYWRSTHSPLTVIIITESVSRITYIVLAQTLNHAQSINQWITGSKLHYGSSLILHHFSDQWTCYHHNWVSQWITGSKLHYGSSLILHHFSDQYSSQYDLGEISQCLLAPRKLTWCLAATISEWWGHLVQSHTQHELLTRCSKCQWEVHYSRRYKTHINQCGCADCEKTWHNLAEAHGHSTDRADSC